MQELLQELLSQARNAWRFRWWGVLVAWVVAVGGWGWVALQKDVYEASTRILVDDSSVLAPLLGNQIVDTDLSTRLATVRQSMLGRDNLEQVARANNLDVTALNEADRERVLDQLAAAVEITASAAGAQGSSAGRDAITAFTIKYRHPDPQTATGVVTSFKDILIENTLAGSSQESEKAGSFFDEQIAANKALLTQAEQARLEYRREHQDTLPSSGTGIQQRIQQEEDALDKALREKRLAEAGLDELQKKLSGESPLVSSSDDLVQREPPAGTLDAKIRDARADCETLKQRYTDAVPQVQRTCDHADELEAQRAELLRSRGVLDPDQELSSLSSNSVYDGIKIDITDTQVKIRQLDADIADRQNRLADLKSRMEGVLEVETALDKFDRDIEGYEDTARSLAAAKERQRMTYEAAQTDPANFLVPDPPRASTDPVAPKRLMLLAGVFVAALGAGGGLCWLLAQLKPVFSTPRALREIVGLPVLGCVGHVTISKAAKARQRLSFLAFAGAIACLVVVYGGATLFEVAGSGVRGLFGGS